MWVDVKSGHQIYDEGDGTVGVHIMEVMQVMSGMHVVVMIADNAMGA